MTAEKACEEIKEVCLCPDMVDQWRASAAYCFLNIENMPAQACGRPVGVHISRARLADEHIASAACDEGDQDASINKLLRLLRSHPDKRAAIAAALKAVLSLPAKARPVGGVKLEVRQGGKGKDIDQAGSGTDGNPPNIEDALPDPSTYLECFPRCKHLVAAFRANPSTHNKTPLAILHEYATRLSLEVLRHILP